MGGGSSGRDYDYRSTSDVTKRSAASYRKRDKAVYKPSLSGKLPPAQWKGGPGISTNAEAVIVQNTDVTGSMSKWPGVFFVKNANLYFEALGVLYPNVMEEMKKGKKPTMEEFSKLLEISFAANGDANCDHYPLQVCKFAASKNLDPMLNSLYPEGGGGGHARETYELNAYYYLKHCEMPNAKIKLFIFACDEGYYSKLNKLYVKRYIGDDLQKDLDSLDIMKQLAKKFTTYALRVPYGDSTLDKRIQKQWEDTLGPQNVKVMKDPNRIVDDSVGLAAIERGTFDDVFLPRLKQRQTPKQVNEVMKTLYPDVKR